MAFLVALTKTAVFSESFNRLCATRLNRQQGKNFLATLTVSGPLSAFITTVVAASVTLRATYRHSGQTKATS